MKGPGPPSGKHSGKAPGSPIGYLQIARFSRRPTARTPTAACARHARQEPVIRRPLALRLETRCTRHGGQGRTTLFEEVGVTVPAVLKAGGIGLSSSLAWHF